MCVAGRLCCRTLLAVRRPTLRSVWISTRVSSALTDGPDRNRTRSSQRTARLTADTSLWPVKIRCVVFWCYSLLLNSSVVFVGGDDRFVTVEKRPYLVLILPESHSQDICGHLHLIQLITVETEAGEALKLTAGPSTDALQHHSDSLACRRQAGRTERCGLEGRLPGNESGSVSNEVRSENSITQSELWSRGEPLFVFVPLSCTNPAQNH